MRNLLIFLLLSSLAAEPRYRMPSPRYSVRIETDVRVPMRDGVRLATDLYIPEGAGEKLPAIMIRTPYNRKVRTEAAP